MQKLSLAEMKEKAKETFECYPNIGSLWMVENGISFLPKQKGDAKDYAKRLKLAEPIEITRADATAADSPATDAVAGATEADAASAAAAAAPAPAKEVKEVSTNKVTKPAKTSKQ
jgi:hypothetical protein